VELSIKLLPGLGREVAVVTAYAIGNGSFGVCKESILLKLSS
jgi:hypothetical protein